MEAIFTRSNSCKHVSEIMWNFTNYVKCFTSKFIHDLLDIAFIHCVVHISFLGGTVIIPPCPHRVLEKLDNLAPKSLHKYLSSLRKAVHFLMTEVGDAELDLPLIDTETLHWCNLRIDGFMQGLKGPIKKRESLLKAGMRSKWW